MTLDSLRSMTTEEIRTDLRSMAREAEEWNGKVRSIHPEDDALCRQVNDCCLTICKRRDRLPDLEGDDISTTFRLRFLHTSSEYRLNTIREICRMDP